MSAVRGLGSTYLEGFTMSELTRAADLQQQTGSPFDALRRTDDQGEFWSARDLMTPLGYRKWERFSDAVERGRIALSVDGIDPDVHICSYTSTFPGAGEDPTFQHDYRLTREGAYAVVQGGDPRKKEIAAAWSYFRQMVILAEQQNTQQLLIELQKVQEQLKTLQTKVKTTKELTTKPTPQKRATEAMKMLDRMSYDEADKWLRRLHNRFQSRRTPDYVWINSGGKPKEYR